MLKSQVGAASLQNSLALQMNEGHHGSVSRGSSSQHLQRLHNNINVNYVMFNQDASCVAVGLNSGYKIFDCKTARRRCFHTKKNESVGIIEMLYSTSLIAVVGLGEEAGSSPRKLKIINTKRQTTICDLIFPLTILQVKLTRSRMIVLLEEQIYIYDITTMSLLHTIETSPNAYGLGAISNDDCDGASLSYLAYPSPPKTITHDSLLVTGINTNGGSNSVQNNIQSVSNSPNRVGDVIIFDLDSLQPISVIEAHKSTLAAITLSKDGTLLATASDKGTIVRVFSVDSGVKLYQFRRGTYPTKIFSLSFSSDNKYVVATSSSETVHIFRLGEEESLETKHKKKRSLEKQKRKTRKDPEYETITEENEEEEEENDDNEEEENDDIQDDGDDSDVDDAEEGVDDEDDEESLEIIPNKIRKRSRDSFNSINSEDQELRSEPIVDQTRLSVARLIRRSSQTLGRKAAQKMGDFLPSRFSSILEPTRHFASFKINTIGRDVKSIAVMNNEVQNDMVPRAYLNKEPGAPVSPGTKDLLPLNLIHISVVTSEGLFYIYGLDPERGGDCILLHQYSLLDESLNE